MSSFNRSIDGQLIMAPVYRIPEGAYTVESKEVDTEPMMFQVPEIAAD